MQLYWQAKIWGLLHDPIFKALHDNHGRGGTGWWENLPAMEEWKVLPAEQKNKLIDYVKIADQISSASDRGAIGNLEIAVDYNSDGLEISHLLSGAKQDWQTKANRHQQVASRSGNQSSIRLLLLGEESPSASTIAAIWAVNVWTPSPVTVVVRVSITESVAAEIVPIFQSLAA